MTEREALNMALQALETLMIERGSIYDKATTAIREALADPSPNFNCKSVQARLATAWGYVKAPPEQEPVAWYRDEDGIRIYYETKCWDDAIPLYTAPQTWEKFCDSNCVWTDHHPDCKLAQQQDKGLGAYPISRTNDLEIKPNDRRTETSNHYLGKDDSKIIQTGRGAEIHTGGAELGAYNGNFEQYEGVNILSGPSAPEQPKQKPVMAGWLRIVQGHTGFVATETEWGAKKPEKAGMWIPLYTTPPQCTWVGLTLDERIELAQDIDWAAGAYCEYAEKIEAKLKEKNT